MGKYRCPVCGLEYNSKKDHIDCNKSYSVREKEIRVDVEVNLDNPFYPSELSDKFIDALLHIEIDKYFKKYPEVSKVILTVNGDKIMELENPEDIDKLRKDAFKKIRQIKGDNPLDREV